MGKNPDITIITSVLNGAKFLETTIQSILQQTAHNIEYIIIDGGSTDGTLDIIKKYENQISYWISESDTGIYNAWNKALTKAKGEWICFLGCDDFFSEKHTLEKAIVYLKDAYPKYSLVYGKTYLISRHNQQLIMELGEPWHKIKQRFLQQMCIPHRSTFHHYSLFEKYGNFDDNLKISGDYDFLLRDLKTNSAYFIDLPIVYARTGGISLNRNTLTRQLEERKILRQNNNMSLTREDILLYIKVYIYLLLTTLIGKKLTVNLLDFYRQLTGRLPIWQHMIK